MKSPRRLVLDLPAGSPPVWLLDATESGLDDAGLRQVAKELAVASGASHISRSYRFPYALIAAHTGPVGIDIERVEALDERFLESISTPAERSSGGARNAEYAATMWSSKEAIAKALGDALAYEPRRLESPLSWSDGRSGPWRALTLPVPTGHVGWVCWSVDAADPELG